MENTIEAEQIDDELDEVNKAFYGKAKTAFNELFATAQSKNELQFALSLNPEFHGYESSPKRTYQETFRAFDEYMEFLTNGVFDNFKLRVAMSFYCHLSEASGFYELPENLMRIIEGEIHTLFPFDKLIKTHKITGNKISPNTNKIFTYLVGHATNVGLAELAEVFRDAFNPVIRNAYAHADYVITTDNIILGKRINSQRKTMSFEDFFRDINKGLLFFQSLRETLTQFIHSYEIPKTGIGYFGENQKVTYKLFYNKEKNLFEMSGTTLGTADSQENK